MNIFCKWIIIILLIIALIYLYNLNSKKVEGFSLEDGGTYGQTSIKLTITRPDGYTTSNNVFPYNLEEEEEEYVFTRAYDARINMGIFNLTNTDTDTDTESTKAYSHQPDNGVYILYKHQLGDHDSDNIKLYKVVGRNSEQRNSEQLIFIKRGNYIITFDNNSGENNGQIYMNIGGRNYREENENSGLTFSLSYVEPEEEPAGTEESCPPEITLEDGDYPEEEGEEEDLNTITVGINAHTNIINLIGNQPITLTKQLITVDDNLGGAIDTGDNISVYKNDDDDIIRIYKVTKTGPDESDVDELVLVINISDSSLLVADDLNTRENISNLVYSIDESGLLTRKIDDDDNTNAQYLRINYGDGMDCSSNMIYLIHEEQNYNINAISTTLVSTDPSTPLASTPSTPPDGNNRCRKPTVSELNGINIYRMGITLPEYLELNASYNTECPYGYNGTINASCTEDRIGSYYHTNLVCTNDPNLVNTDGESCIEPTDKTGYIYQENLHGFNNILKRDNFNIIGLSCDNGYEPDDSGPRGIICDGANQEYKLRGCRPICNDPSEDDFPEYNFSNINGTFSLRDINNTEDTVDFNVTGLECADGYHGTPKAEACSMESRVWTPSGCEPYYDCECNNGSPKVSDENGPICTTENEQNCEVCDDGYHKDTTDKLCIPKCSCENGSEDTGCTEPNQVKCAICNQNYFKDNNNNCIKCEVGYVRNIETNECEKTTCLKHLDENKCEEKKSTFSYYTITKNDINCSGTICESDECCTESHTKLIVWFSIIILLLILLGGGYYYYTNQKIPVNQILPVN